jgi:hypothetical protein
MPSIDSLTTLFRNRSITPEMYAAGERFHRTFVFSHLAPSGAPSLERCRAGYCSREGMPERAAAAERALDRALSAVGGIASPGGSALWFVAGLGYSVKEWAVREGWNGRRLNPHEAKGIVVTALGVLAVHYDVNVAQRNSLDRCTSVT